MRQLAILTFLAALSVLPGSWASAACRRSDPGIDVAVGVREAPPFVFEDPIRGRRGLSLELWESVERELKAAGLIRRGEIVDCPVGEELQALAAGEIDMVISPMTITAERMALVDFTQPYLGSGLTVARRAGGGIDLGRAAGILWVTAGQNPVGVVLLLALAAAGVALGLPRRRRFLRRIGLRVADGYTIAAAVAAVPAISVLALATAALVGATGGNRTIEPGDLPGMRVATLIGSPAQAMLEALALRGRDAAAGWAEPPLPVRGKATMRRLERVSALRRPRGACVPHAVADRVARCVTTASWGEAVAMLLDGEADAVLGDWAQLSWLARLPRSAGRLEVQGATFGLEPYGWAVSARRPDLRAAVDRALVQRIARPEWRGMVRDYLGTRSISPD